MKTMGGGRTFGRYCWLRVYSGILLVMTWLAFGTDTNAATILVNGSFEAPVIASNTNEANISPTGWAVIPSNNGGHSSTFLFNGANDFFPLPQDGNQYFDIGNNSVAISQVFSIETDGVYTLTWYDNTAFEENNLTSLYSVKVSSQTLGIIAVADLDAHHGAAWSLHSMDLILSAGSYTLSFTEAPASSGLDTLLDNVTLVSTNKLTSVLTWPVPGDIVYGTLLSGAQLNATTTPNVPGSFVYTTAAKLNAGNNPLAVVFTPTDTAKYTTASANVTIIVHPMALTVSAVTDNKVYDGTTDSVEMPIISLGSLTAGDSANWAQIFDNRNVGMDKTLIPFGLVSDGNGGNNYDVIFINNTAGVITAAPITVTAKTDSKVYDSKTNSTGVPTITSGSLVGGDTTDWMQAFDNKNVGTGKTLTPFGLVSDGNGGNNYDVTYIDDNSGIISAFPLTIVGGISNKVYDGTPTAMVSFITDNKFPGDDLTDLYGLATFSDKNVGNGKTVTLMGIEIIGNDSQNYFAPATIAETKANITTRPLTVTAATDSKVYDGTTSSIGLPTITIGSLGAGDSATWTQAFDNKNVGTGKSLKPAGLVSDGKGGNNYVVTFANDVAGVIARRSLTVAATGISKVYDGATTAMVTLTDNKVSGDNVSDHYASAAFADTNVGVGKTVSVNGITISGTDAINYALVNSTAITTADIFPPQYLPPPTIVSVFPNSGPTNGGTRVVISGLNFQSGATVAFGSLPGASVIFNDSTGITATTPSNSVGPVNIIITNPDSQTTILSNGFAYTNSNPISSDLVQNGSFESPIVSSDSVFHVGESFGGFWTVEDSTSDCVIYNDPGNIFYSTPDGSQFAYLGDSLGVTVLRQDLATILRASNTYKLSFLQSTFAGDEVLGLVTVSIAPAGSTNAVFTQDFSVGAFADWTQQQTSFTVPGDGLYSLRLTSTQSYAANVDDVSILVAGIAEATNPPSIVTQPISQLFTIGGNANLTVRASGSGPLNYQWQFDGTNLQDNTRLTGSGGSTLIISNLLVTDAGDYRVIITNSFGAITSSIASLSVSNGYSNLVQNGGFESPVVSSDSVFHVGESIGGFWTVEDSTRDCVIYNNPGGIFYPTPAGSQFAYLGDSLGVTVLRQDLATILRASNTYKLSFLQSTFAGDEVLGLVTVSIAPAGSTNAVFTQDFSVGAFADWTQQQTSFTVPGDGLYSLRLTSTQSYVANVDDVSILVAGIVGATNPPVFQNIAWSGNSIALTWSAVSGQKHQLQYQTNLNNTNWINTGPSITATNGIISTSDFPGSDLQRYYRVMVSP